MQNTNELEKKYDLPNQEFARPGQNKENVNT